MTYLRIFQDCFSFPGSLRNLMQKLTFAVLLTNKCALNMFSEHHICKQFDSLFKFLMKGYELIFYNRILAWIKSSWFSEVHLIQINFICNLRPFNLYLDFWKSRSWEIKVWSNRRKISVPAHLDFFQVYGINLSFFLGEDLEKKSTFAGRPWFFKTLIFRNQGTD